MALSWLGRLHGVFLVWSLLFLAASLIGAGSFGFEPDRSRYRDPAFQFKGAGRPRFVLSLFPDPAGRKLVILDAAAGADVRGVDPEIMQRLAQFLRTKGMIVERAQGADPLPLAEGADLLILACDLEAYVDIDFAALSKVMRGRYLFDYAGYWDSAEADAAGLPMVNFARQYWPHWLDPDMEAYVEYLRETVPEGDGILMLPGRELNNTQTRSRWYLPLNVKLGNRRLYLWNPMQGTSYVTEYYGWVQAYNEKDPWKETKPIGMEKRGYSAIPDFAPTRTLTAEEIATAERCNVQWILYWSHQPDFRLADWELIPLETALRWTREAGQ